MTVVIHGKHPAYGDFLSFGIEHGPAQKLDDWAQTVLPALREALDFEWDTAWANAPDLRFWIGADVLGVPLFGIWRTSQDKVGRRYPLIFAQTGWITPPPVDQNHDASPFEAIEQHMVQLDQTVAEGGGVQALLDGFSPPQPTGTPFVDGQNGTLWGRRDDDDLGRLLTDAQSADARSAQYGRSHWWHPQTPQHDAGWLAVNGLPDHATLLWLLTGRTRAAPQADQTQTPPTQPAADLGQEGSNSDQH